MGFGAKHTVGVETDTTVGLTPQITEGYGSEPTVGCYLFPQFAFISSLQGDSPKQFSTILRTGPSSYASQSRYICTDFGAGCYDFGCYEANFEELAAFRKDP